MKFLIFTSLICSVFGQDLFEGDACNLNIPNFNTAPNPNDFAVENGKVDYINGNMVMTLQPPAAGGTTGFNALASNY